MPIDKEDLKREGLRFATRALDGAVDAMAEIAQEWVEDVNKRLTKVRKKAQSSRNR